MTKEQEAQQAQTKSVHGWLLDMQDYLLPIRLKESIDTGFGKEFGEYLIERCRRAESIVDSQSQKIAEQTETITELMLKSSEKIAEQKKKIEILEKCYYAAMNRFAFDSDENRNAWYEAQNNKRDSEEYTVDI